MTILLKIKDLRVTVKNNKHLLQEISLTIERGHIIGITGASGSGKTTLMKSILGMLDDRECVMGGSICFDGEDITNVRSRKRRDLCGKTIGYIPQNPMTAFDPRITIGKQLEETLCIRLGVKRDDALKLCLGFFEMLNLEDGKRILESYPAQISGGMLQRIVVALTFSMNLTYILADEPTSALDEENRDILIEALKRRQKESGILLVSHDVEALCSLCEKVFVMEGGKIIEEGNMDQLLTNPQKDWTKAFSKVHTNGVERSFAWKNY